MENNDMENLKQEMKTALEHCPFIFTGEESKAVILDLTRKWWSEYAKKLYPKLK